MPTDRDQIIAKVRHAIEDELEGQAGNQPDRYSNWIDTTQLATAAFDALIQAWSPPW